MHSHSFLGQKIYFLACDTNLIIGGGALFDKPIGRGIPFEHRLTYHAMPFWTILLGNKIVTVIDKSLKLEIAPVAAEPTKKRRYTVGSNVQPREQMP